MTHHDEHHAHDHDDEHDEHDELDCPLCFDDMAEGWVRPRDVPLVGDWP